MRGRFFSSALLRQLAPIGAPVRAAARVAADGTEPTHDPLLAPRDEAVFLLTAAAEIEHALMVQYLYAAYSVRAPRGSTPAELDRIQDLLFQIAREEMGHLATVQNLLHLIGGPLNFNREHSPYASEIYPFRFKLEPLTLDSLAKYVIAESPQRLPDRFPAEDEQLLLQLAEDARRSNDGRPVSHVGAIFARLQRLFRGDGGLLDEDFRLDRRQLQARFGDWGYKPRQPSEGEALIIESFDAA
jgi:ferritin-like protein